MPDAVRSRFASGRHAGALVPLFSIPSRPSWGIGEIPDLVRLARWLESAGLDFVQLLPVNEMQEGQSSPYSALSAMAVDPIFIALAEVEDFADAGGDRALDVAHRVRLDGARRAATVDYASVRAAKEPALRVAFDSFLRRHHRSSSRARAFQEFRDREAWWLSDYALFRALHEEHHARHWLDWQPPLRDREPAALAAARRRLAAHVLYFEYLQWLADEQWQRARRDSGRVGIFGDFPFMVSGHSADVWARQHEFRTDVSVGVPPDAFSATGQDWGLPAYRWDVVAEGGYQWLRDRTRRCAELYDAFRIDHLVGFYRTYLREPDGTACFTPADESAQREQGERLLSLFAESGACIIAEDLGIIPDFVRASLEALGVPGLKVFRWERDWKNEGGPFLDPAGYAAASVAISGTHDTASVAEWWDTADEEERRAVAEVPALRAAHCDPSAPFSERIRDAILEALFGAGSNLLILPLQDVFGWRSRINTPASVSEDNWTWRLPWPVEDLMSEPLATERARALRALALRHGRAR